MRSISVRDLVFEVTRRCNMHCAHCLRGEPQNLDMTTEIMDRTLDQVDQIGWLLFSGGEPSLNSKMIRYAVDQVIRKQKNLESFYIVTNGKRYSPVMVNSLIDLYGYILGNGGENDMCGLALSKDEFHGSIRPENENRLRALTFFTEDKIHSFSDGGIIDEGRAESLDQGKRPYSREMLDIVSLDSESLEIDNTLYISAKGDVLIGCDFSYAREDREKMGNILETPLEKMLLKRAAAAA